VGVEAWLHLCWTRHCMEVSGLPDDLSAFHPGKEPRRAGNTLGPKTCLDVIERATTLIAGISTNRQGWQCTCVNVIFGCVLATIVAVGVLHIVCSALSFFCRARWLMPLDVPQPVRLIVPTLL
jgi:hypothetical protein